MPYSAVFRFPALSVACNKSCEVIIFLHCIYVYQMYFSIGNFIYISTILSSNSVTAEKRTSVDIKLVAPNITISSILQFGRLFFRHWILVDILYI
jgi:hypothetical protein